MIRYVPPQETKRIALCAIKVPLVMDSDIFNQFSQMVSPEKNKRIIRFKNQVDAYRTLVADVLIRSVICRELQLRNSDLTFSKNPYGKPYLVDAPNFNFNVSHSGKWIVCITHNASVGIDIEEIKPIDLSMAERFLSREEYNDLFAQLPEDRLHYFYDLWTLKESYIKAIGKGMFIPLNSFTIRKSKNEDITLLDNQLNQLSMFYFKQYILDEMYKMSVCATIADFPNEIIIRDILELRDEMINKYL
ncbi:4'-phosphopantetheinyl transferase family protein [Brevibacillus sp. SAFN-007a]|uniref:4'-phosphopantetheinyl transferase family protein n=1 Tax=Brevibacillus sp. SAFN-007a TaxID=3436862 RepID=UPI003F8193F2